jgi:hypothetical protein
MSSKVVFEALNATATGGFLVERLVEAADPRVFLVNGYISNLIGV